MNSNGSIINHTVKSPERRRSPLPLVILAVLFVVVPFLTWYLTWFGRPLSDDQIDQYLSDANKPRNVQHALLQIADRIARGDRTAKRWYPRIVAMTDHHIAEIRVTAAWAMGHDNTSEEFHNALLKFLEDPNPMVRRNAALSLVRFADPKGKPELTMMLRPYAVRSDRNGTVSILAREGGPVAQGTLLARITDSNGQVFEVRSPFSSRVKSIGARDGSVVAVGDELVKLAPEADQVWEALRALYLIGQMEDIPDVERYAQGISGMPDRIRQQATLTAEAIRSRAR